MARMPLKPGTSKNIKLADMANRTRKIRRVVFDAADLGLNIDNGDKILMGAVNDTKAQFMDVVNKISIGVASSVISPNDGFNEVLEAAKMVRGL